MKIMKTKIEKILNWYSDKADFSKELWIPPCTLTYYLKRWPQLKPSLKKLVLKWMEKNKRIEKWEYTFLTLFEYEQ